jgi:glutamate/tyrosine decarboxylase-like PLP-dependent enzyme
MKERIKELEEEARKLEVGEKERAEWEREVMEYGNRFVEGLARGKAFEQGGDMGAALLELPLDGSRRGIGEVLGVLKRALGSSGLNPASGGHLGYIPGGGVYPAALGDYLAAVTNEYAGIYFAGPAAVRMEHMLIRWMCKLCGYGEEALGNLTSGGSIANLIAFVTARDSMEITSLRVRQSVIYLTEQVHHCVHKAIRIGGLMEAQVRTVAMDARYRMDAEKLKSMIRADRDLGLHPFLVIASAGTTDTGAVDPLDAIADICEAEELWFHVDAAYGGFFLLADLPAQEGGTVKGLLKGIERSDSLAIDPHKGMFLPYGVGAVLIRDVEAQLRSHHYRASYMQDSFGADGEWNPADLSPELTRHWRGLRMWLPLQLYGIAPFKAALEEKILLCRDFYARVAALGFEVGPYPDLSVCIYRYVPKEGDADAFNAALVDRVQRDGRVFVSSTRINGVYWIRLAVLCFRTHLVHTETLLELLAEGVEEQLAN